MTDDSSSNSSKEKKVPFGTRLKNARESLGLQQKEVATHLRLSEKIIVMMEKDRYPADLPVTFVRGYIRAYAKYLNFSETDIVTGLEPIKSKNPEDATLAVMQPITMLNDRDNNFIKIFTYLSFLTFLTLATVWYYNHQKNPKHLGLFTTQKEQSTNTSPQLTDQQLRTLADSKNTLTTLNPAPKPNLVFNNARIMKRDKKSDREIDIDLYN